MRLLFLFSLAISLVFATANPIQGDDLTSEVCKENVDFALRLYKEISAKTARAPPNLSFSPISVYNSLYMLLLGAKSRTRRDILEAMDLDAQTPDKDLHEAFKKCLNTLGQLTDQVKLRFGNEAFFAQSVKILPTYNRDLLYYYNTSVHSISFDNPKKAEATINTLVSDNTGNKIQHLVRDLSADTAIMLVDYAVFEGKWNVPFQPQDTTEGFFSVNENRKVLVPMMRRVGLYKTYKDQKTKNVVVQIPYNHNTVLLLIVPKLGDLYYMERSLTPQVIKQYLCLTKTSLLDFSMPRVAINNPINLKYALLALEMGVMFNSDKADFSGISSKSKLRVSEIYHQSYTNITEGKSDWSGATVSQALSSNPEFRANRPFLMMVCRTDLFSILFMGRVLDPSLI